MAKFYGVIGFVKDEEDQNNPGVWIQTETERPYYGDVLRRSRRWDQATEVNDHLTLSDEINVIADSYILENLNYMRYVIYLGVKWKINYIEVNRPRIRLTLGGEYNGEQTATASGTN